MVVNRLWLISYFSIIWIGLANPEKVSAASLERPYLLRLADHVASWQHQLPEMDDSAKSAAKGTIAGGHLYAFGPQPGFALEIHGRAGGLMLARPYSSDVELTARDTVLAALNGSEDESERSALRHLLAQADDAGAQVVLFGVSSAIPVKDARIVILPRNRVFERDQSIASVSNVVGMWAWTGRFIAACVSQGKMPCMYQSAILPDGRERSAHLAQLNGGRFHINSNVLPQDAERIAADYLIKIEHALRQILATELDELERAASLLRASRDRGNTVAIHTLGHMFPGEFDQPQQPAWLVHVDALQPAASVDTAVVLYYMSFPWSVVDKVHEANQACIVICSQPALPHFTSRSGNVYLNPYWSVPDAVVELPNYDVQVLPASGVLDAALYWQLIEIAVKESQ